MQSRDLIQEYSLVKKRAQKLVIKSSEYLPLKKKRALKKIKSFIRRLLEIEDICAQLGYPHPETLTKSLSQTDIQRELDKLKSTSKALLKPDGTLASTSNVEHKTVKAAAAKILPNGTLFVSPKTNPQTGLLDT